MRAAGQNCSFDELSKGTAPRFRTAIAGNPKTCELIVSELMKYQFGFVSDQSNDDGAIFISQVAGG